MIAVVMVTHALALIALTFLTSLNRLPSQAIFADRHQSPASAEVTDEANRLRDRGIASFQAGQWQESIDDWKQALGLYQSMGNQVSASKLLINIGLAYRKQNNYSEALRYFEQGLRVNRELDNQDGETAALTHMGVVYDLLSQYSLALQFHRQSLELARRIDSPIREFRALGNLGIVYKKLGDYGAALDAYEQSLLLVRDADDPVNEARVLNNIGQVHRYLKNYDNALQAFAQSLILKRQLDDQQGEATTLGNIGIVYSLQENYSQALEYYQQSLELSQTSRFAVGKLRVLNNLGELYQLMGDYDTSLLYYQRSLAIATQLNLRPAQGTILSNLGLLYRANQQPSVAILFLKQAINQYEAIRADNQSLTVDLQTSYVDTVADTYRQLADLLLQQNRVLEAQRVLDLLKVQEVQDYFNNVRGNARTASGIEFYQAEQDILDQYERLQTSAIEIGQEISQLEEATIQGTLTPAEQPRLDQLLEVQDQLFLQFNEFTRSDDIQRILQQMAADESSFSIQEISSLGDNLEQLNAVLIYPLVLEDRIELIITTANAPPLRRTVKHVSRAELNSAIATFRSVLQQPTQDAKGSAYQLYRWLIEPLEEDLSRANAQTILYAPDGPLRYVPLAALYDSANASDGQWLAERFQINNITATSLQNLNTQPLTAPRILAAAFADETVTHTVNVGNQTLKFSGLPFAGIEVSILARTLSNIQTYIDNDFSLASLRSRLNTFNILHFATHASLVPRDAGESFILFGNGDRPTIRDIETWRLTRVDLVVLSACETGLGGFDNNGEQVLGLGYQFQRQGARAVVASLWQVDDGGTQTLMNAFYLAINAGYSKTEALQKAQLALINNDLSSITGEPRAAINILDTITGDPIRLKASPDHPYYWAPFILIGNGL
ncbi:hypothetical protein Lepto7375DRAFT_0278 [Leptolyngbya sp. PCC 7375]|nr:hypothetical protein Lepto7375DRAFT_0278 [Leptolyngbya sp. PCC 7375]